MNAMSKLGYDPDLALWEDPNTLLHSISFTDFKDYETGVRVKTYSATQMSTEYGGHAHRSLTIPGSGYLEVGAATYISEYCTCQYKFALMGKGKVESSVSK